MSEKENLNEQTLFFYLAKLIILFQPSQNIRKPYGTYRTAPQITMEIT